MIIGHYSPEMKAHLHHPRPLELLYLNRYLSTSEVIDDSGVSIAGLSHEPSAAKRKNNFNYKIRYQCVHRPMESNKEERVPNC